MLTIFACPKAFDDPHTAVLQGNALGSWARLGDDARVLVCGDDPGVGEAAAAVGATHLPEIARNARGTPLLDDIFRQAHEHSDSPVLCYVNADIVLCPAFMASVRAVAAQCERFLMVGRRRTVPLAEALDFSGDWVGRCRDLAATTPPDAPTAIDYFLFPRGMYGDIPAFAIGRVRWDNWMLWQCRQLGAPLVDASPDVLAIHQAHGYGHLREGAAGSRSGPEAEENLRLAGGWGHVYTIADASHLLVDGEVRPARSFAHWRRRAFRFLQRFKHRLTDSPPAGGSPS